MKIKTLGLFRFISRFIFDLLLIDFNIKRVAFTITENQKIFFEKLHFKLNRIYQKNIVKNILLSSGRFTFIGFRVQACKFNEFI